MASEWQLSTKGEERRLVWEGVLSPSNLVNQTHHCTANIKYKASMCAAFSLAGFPAAQEWHVCLEVVAAAGFCWHCRATFQSPAGTLQSDNVGHGKEKLSSALCTKWKYNQRITVNGIHITTLPDYWLFEFYGEVTFTYLVKKRKKKKRMMYLMYRLFFTSKATSVSLFFTLSHCGEWWMCKHSTPFIKTLINTAVTSLNE